MATVELLTVPSTRAPDGYLPRRLRTSAARVPIEVVDGTLLLADVSGFTRLSERLARAGTAGTETMISAISQVFTALLDAIETYDGDVLEIAGDALLVLLEGPDHAARAQAAAAAIRRAIALHGRLKTPSGVVRLGVSIGIASGPVVLLLAGSRLAALVAWGPTMEAVTQAQHDAARDTVLVAAAVELDSLPWARAERVSRAGLTPARQLGSFVPATLASQLADTLADGEHRVVTTAFVSYDTLGPDPDSAVVQLGLLLDAVARLSEAEGLTITCVESDGCGLRLMLTAGAPQWHEQDADATLRVVTALRADAPAGTTVRAGVTRGHAFAGVVGAPRRYTWSAMGDPVNLAARLAALAGPGEVLATAELLARVHGVLPSRPRALLWVRGRRGQVVVHDVDGPPRERVVPTERSTLVGRDTEVAVLRRAAVESSGVVDVHGAPGVGTSRLVAEALAELPSWQLFARSDLRAVPYAGIRPLLLAALGASPRDSPAELGQVLTAWVSTYAPELGDSVELVALAAQALVPGASTGAPLDERFVAAAIARAVAAVIVGSPLLPRVLVVDRAAGLDQASRDVVTAVARGAAEHARLLVAVRRDSEPALGGTVVDLPVAALGAEAGIALARELLTASDLPRAPAQEIATAAHGVPRVLRDLVAAWTPAGVRVPDTVEAIAALRLERLPAPLGRLVRYASVLGELVDVTLLAQMLDDPSDRALAATAALLASPAVWLSLGDVLVAAGPSRVQFVDPLTAEVAYQSLPFARRRVLHRRAARALAADRATPAAVLAAHFDGARDLAQVWRYAVLAGDLARGVHAYGDAVVSYARAVQAGPLAGVDPDQVAAVAERWGDAARLAGDFEGAVAGYRAALAGAAPGARARLLLQWSWVEMNRGRTSTALRLASNALAAADTMTGLPAQRAKAAAWTRRAGARIRQGRLLEAERAATTALEHAVAAGATEWEARAHLLLDSALCDTGRPELALPHRELALALYTELGDAEGVGQTLNNHGVAAYWAGDLLAARGWYEQSRAAFERAGDLVSVAMLDNNLGEVASDLGELDEAEDRFAAAQAVSARAGHAQFEAQSASNLALLLVRRGRAADAVPLLEVAVERFRAAHAAAYVADAQVRLAGALLDSGSHIAGAELVAVLLRELGSRDGLATHTSTVQALAVRAGLAPDTLS